MKEQPIAPFLTQADLWLVSDKARVGRITPSTRISSRFPERFRITDF